MVLGRGVDDRLGDAAGVGLLAVLAEDPGEVADVDAGEEVGGGLAVVGVHAHVEVGRLAEGEAAGDVVELHGGDAEVGQDGADRLDAALPQGGGEIGERGVHELDAVRGQAGAGDAEGLGVAIHGDGHGGAVLGQDCGRVPAQPAGGVDEDPCWRGVGCREHALQGVANLTREHGRVSAAAAHCFHPCQEAPQHAKIRRNRGLRSAANSLMESVA